MQHPLQIRETIRRTPSNQYSVEDLITIQAQLPDWESVWEDRLTTYPELKGKVLMAKLPGKPRPELCTADLESTFYLLGILPGVVGAMYRDAMDSVYERVQAGDITLVDDIARRSNDPEGMRRVYDALAKQNGWEEQPRTIRLLAERGCVPSQLERAYKLVDHLHATTCSNTPSHTVWTLSGSLLSVLLHDHPDLQPAEIYELWETKFEELMDIFGKA